MDIQEGSIIELEYKKKIIKIKKKKHPFEECIGAFDGEEFTEQDHNDAKKTLWESQTNEKEIVILEDVALFYLNKSNPPKILKELQDKIIKSEIKVVIPAIAILEI